MQKHFSAAAVSALSGMPIPTLQMLSWRGILTPSVKKATGRGNAHVYSFGDVVAATVIRRAPNSSGVSQKRIAGFFKKNWKRAEQPQHAIACIDLEGNVFLYGADATLATFDKHGPVTRILALQELLSELRGLILTSTISPPGPTGRRPRPKVTP